MTLPVALLTCSLLVYQTHRLYKAIEQQKGPAFRCAERRRRLVSSGTSLPRNQVVYWLIDTRSTIQASKAEKLQATTGANESKSFRVRHKCSGRKKQEKRPTTKPFDPDDLSERSRVENTNQRSPRSFLCSRICHLDHNNQPTKVYESPALISPGRSLELPRVQYRQPAQPPLRGKQSYATLVVAAKTLWSKRHVVKYLCKAVWESCIAIGNKKNSFDLE